MNEEKLIKQIALNLIPGIGDVLLKQLISYCGGPEEVFKRNKAFLAKVPGIGEKLAASVHGFNNFERAEEEISFIKKHKIQTSFYLDDNYPSRLKDIADAPTLLYTIGNVDLNNSKIVAIVGTRKATDYGKSFTYELVNSLQEYSCLIVSGLAYGIDYAAHKASVEAKLPTIGVLAHGLDRIYPGQHKYIAKQMIINGGLITEFTSQTTPNRENFPKRNRIVAGLCDVLVVVETGIKGGARITAEIANSYNKDIMALPGRVNDETAQGCNYLIKENKASIITCPNDLLELMRWKQEHNSKPKQQKINFNLSADELKILEYIKSKNKAAIDSLVFDLNFDAGNLSLKLLDLEFKGLIRALPGKVFELA